MYICLMAVLPRCQQDREALIDPEAHTSFPHLPKRNFLFVVFADQNVTTLSSPTPLFSFLINSPILSALFFVTTCSNHPFPAPQEGKGAGGKKK